MALIALLLVAAVCYFFFLPGTSVPGLKNFIPSTSKTEQHCPTCKGTGSIRCTASHCISGTVECNGPCLRRSKGTWFKDAKLGHGPDKLWIAFPYKDGIQYFTLDHVGEVVEMRNGKPTLVGKCKICNGTTRMPCKVCRGTALLICPTCHGQKNVSSSVANSSSSPAAPSSRPPVTIRLKDGSTIVGNIVVRDSEIAVIRTTDGKTTEIPVTSLASP